MTQEVHYFGRANGSLVKPRIEVPPSDAGRGREHFPVEVILQHRSLSARRPGAHPMGPLAQPALVDKDDGAPLAERFFLIRGQPHSLPIPEGFFVALQRPPAGALAAPAELAAGCARRELGDSAPRTGPRSARAPGSRSTAR